MMPDAPSGWTHAGAAWYWPGQGDLRSLVRTADMPERMLLRCEVSWKSRISLAIGFHADFHIKDEPALRKDEERPKPKRMHPGDTSIYGYAFGNSYILQLNPTHAMLYRSTLDANGEWSVERMQTSFNNVRLGDNGTASVEIRASRPTGEILLFLNGEFVAQWSEVAQLHPDGKHPHYAGRGNGFGFIMQTPTMSARISDIVVAEWNGMPDAARSMQSEEQDIVLLNNGTDRFSGKLNHISDGVLHLAGRYGDLEFPVADVSEIHFASQSIAAPPDDKASSDIRLRLHPIGVISGKPISGDENRLRLDSAIFGEMDIDLSSAVMIEMYRGESFLDIWDSEF